MTAEARPLREWRLRKLMTAAALAQTAGISLRTYGAIERGESAPRTGTLKKLSEALGVDPMEIAEFRAVIQGPEKGNE